jgi:hypothetical protein
VDGRRRETVDVSTPRIVMLDLNLTSGAAAVGVPGRLRRVLVLPLDVLVTMGCGLRRPGRRGCRAQS